MKVVLVEDERLSLIALENMIKHFCSELEVVGTASSIKKAVPLIKSIQPEVVFLDIQLSDGVSFEILKQLGGYNFKIVFLTAYNKYALQAFDYAAIHYILKPINPKKLKEVIDRLKLLSISTYQLTEHISVLEDAFGNNQKRLAIPTQKEIIFVDIKDIIYCEADNNYTKLYLNTGRNILASKSLIFFEQVLGSMPFVRPHSKYLVNSDYIQKYIRGRGGELLLSNQNELPVSARRKAALIEQLNQYNIEV